jgi:hypothetical protein
MIRFCRRASRPMPLLLAQLDRLGWLFSNLSPGA